MTAAVLELDGITKRFGALTANDGVSLRLAQGEMLALLGENGAGKTTLMNILFGHTPPMPARCASLAAHCRRARPRAAIEAGVGMVHQHFTLASNLNVLDNVIIGSEPLTLLRSHRAKAREKLLALSAKFGLPVDPEARISRLSVGERQRVEILKALYRDARILILDEPTAVLARPEAEQLFQTLRGMTREGLSVVFISHKLGEVMAGSDRVAVLRGGRLVAERETARTTPEELAELMVGRKVARPRRAAHATGAPVLVAERVSVAPGLSEASFEVREGEVLGIVGVSGNGQAALGALVAGQARASGTLTLQGVDFRQKTARNWIAAGAARIPEDRHAQGIVGEMSLWENAILERLRRREFSRGGFVRQAAARAHTAGLIERFDIRGAGPDTRTRLLSGGNMQKLILGRNLAETPRFILANHPPAASTRARLPLCMPSFWPRARPVRRSF